MSKRNNKTRSNVSKLLISFFVLIIIGIIGYFNPNFQEYLFGSTNILTNSMRDNEFVQNEFITTISFDLDSIPEFTNKPYVVLNDNKPNFNENDLTLNSFERYSEIDNLGRCGVAYANLSLNTMPDDSEERGSISSVEPSGWINKKYEIVDGGYLYNRCHLIGYQLSAENANERNLITGTRYMNTEGMLSFENQIADYIKETRNHVLYRVTPIFEDNNLIASGVQLEAMSIEDNGEGICFNVYCYNVQPGITIDYTTGESKENA